MLKGGPANAPPAGVMAVTVSGKTLEATTLVMVSDLDVIIKSSRDEVFVFAENLRTGKPWPNTRLLISNGQQVFAEAQTGDDGVFQKSYEELKSAGDVRVFAVADSSVASNVVGLNNLGVSVGLAERGYIYTDRPAYRAGQMVHVRGIIRKSVDDRFVIEQGKKYRLEVFDGRNRLLRQDDATLGEFGSFHAHFALPAGSVAGEYRVQLRDEEDHSFQGGFAVHEYQLEPVRLAVEVDRKVFYRGEEIEGKISAKFYYGRSAGPSRASLSTGRRPDLIPARPTNGASCPSSSPRVSSASRRRCRSSCCCRNATCKRLRTSILPRAGFPSPSAPCGPCMSPVKRSNRKSPPATRKGKPIAEKLLLHVLEQTTVDGKVGEREVERHELSTDEKQGQGRLTLRLEKGGKYILRVEGTDRFKNPISAAHVVRISDDNDAVRLRILADKHTFKVGDTARVQLHWREAPALARGDFPRRPRARLQAGRPEAGRQRVANSAHGRAGPEL